jgi:two-component system, LytTR family, sensor histidine kinase AlgZ
MRRILPLPHHRLHLIPNFCRWPAILQLAFIMELVAVVLTLGGGAGCAWRGPGSCSRSAGA